MAYTLIATQTLVAPSGTVTFSNIPGTFKDLVLECSGMAGATLYLQFNSDTASNYSRTYVSGSGTAAVSGRNTSLTGHPFGAWSTTVVCASILNVLSYANSNVYKTAIGRDNRSDDGTQAGVYLWRSTSAISSMNVYVTSGTISANSTFKLWGVS